MGCSVLFFLLLDKCLDPIFESIFTQSEQDYEEMMQSLVASPVTSLIQVCVLAPVIEEILMRGVVLGGLKNTYGSLTALLISAAFLHFCILIWCRLCLHLYVELFWGCSI
ncbi:MAG: CPBP family intramembrane metalloprotease [Clostridium sp.]|nr:CPBP family intramembrane metalloprotease [Clostridium sp.]